MQARLFGVFAAFAAVAALGFGAAIADEVKPAKKDAKECPDSKKDACGDSPCGEEKAAKKTDGCCGDDEKAAAKKKDCDGCGENTAKMSKAMSCDACNKSEKGPCDYCVNMVKTGKVVFVPIKGMTCSSCEGAVSKKLEGIDGVGKYMVAHRFNGAAIAVAPGKTVKISELKKALGEEMTIDESAPIKGKISIIVEGTTAEDTAKVFEAMSKLTGVAATAKCTTPCHMDADKKIGVYTMCAGEKGVSMKQITETMSGLKFKLVDIAFHGGAKEESKKSS